MSKSSCCDYTVTIILVCCRFFGFCWIWIIWIWVLLEDLSGCGCCWWQLILPMMAVARSWNPSPTSSSQTKCYGLKHQLTWNPSLPSTFQSICTWFSSQCIPHSEHPPLINHCWLHQVHFRLVREVWEREKREGLIEIKNK